MKHLQPAKSLFISLMLLVCFTSCSRDAINSDKNLSGISVKLKSTAGQYDKVYIDIKDIQLKVKVDENTSNAWVSLNTINTGTHNLFDLREDSELLLVDNFAINATFIHEIRLVLGDNNFIDLNNTLHSLDVSNLGNSNPSNLVRLDLVSNSFYDFVINIDIDNSLSYDEAQNIMVLNPEIYTAIRQIQY